MDGYHPRGDHQLCCALFDFWPTSFSEPTGARGLISVTLLGRLGLREDEVLGLEADGLSSPWTKHEQNVRCLPMVQEQPMRYCQA